MMRWRSCRAAAVSAPMGGNEGMVTLTAGTPPLNMSLYTSFGQANGLLTAEPDLISVQTTTGYLIDFHGQFDFTSALH